MPRLVIYVVTQTFRFDKSTTLLAAFDTYSDAKLCLKSLMDKHKPTSYNNFWFDIICVTRFAEVNHG